MYQTLPHPPQTELRRATGWSSDMKNIQNFLVRCCFAIAMIGISAHSVSATAITGAPSTGLVSPTVSIDFEAGAIAASTVITTQFAGVTLGDGSNGFIMSTGGAGTGTQNINGRYLDSFNSSLVPGAIKFDGQVSAAGFNLRTNADTTTFTAFLNGVIVESFSASTDLDISNNFFGFTGIIFDEIQFDMAIVGQQGFNLDNLEFVTVPEPSSIALFGLGLIGLGAMRRRKTA
jgi:hypothetical protein